VRFLGPRPFRDDRPNLELVTAPKQLRQIRDRIVELRRVPAGELRANPRNWRRHPDTQRKALDAMLGDVGFAGAAIAYDDGEGLVLIDGHLRADRDPAQLVPVLVLDVDESEASKLLATFDPLGAMAVPDDEALAALLGEVELPEAATPEELERRAVSFEAGNGKEHECPSCGHSWVGPCKPAADG
jgi:hypothetical protein